ncbi:MAG TPA: transcriptional regulator [Pirellulales bacterium]
MNLSPKPNAEAPINAAANAPAESKAGAEAKSNAEAKTRGEPHDGGEAKAGGGAKAGGDGPLDPLIHEASRLVIVAVLSECESADFNFLLGATSLTRGNLSTHMAKLLAAGYASETKQFIDRKQNTQYRLTDAGRTAYIRYRQAWHALTGGSHPPDAAS